MLTFKELAHPVEGWVLNTVHNTRTLERETTYWEVTLMAKRSGKLVSATNRDIELAWTQAVRMAEDHDAKLAGAVRRKLRV